MLRFVRIHRILAEACVGLLGEVFVEKKVLDRVMAVAFKGNPKWGKRDRGFVAESVWEVVRWRRALAFVADSQDPRGLLAAQWQKLGWEIPEWWSWQGAGLVQMTAREAGLSDQPRAIRESVPDWLDALGVDELGERWDAELTELNRRARVFLRVNRLQGTREQALAWLESERVEVALVDGLEDALVLPQGKLLPKNLAQDGRVEIQDAGSQMLVPLMGVEPGMRVVDACCGAGGKTLQLAAEMQNKGEILALDVSTRKLSELKRRVGRAGARNVRAEAWKGDTLRRRRAWADRVLIDAPCSGLGSLKRQPDLKWRLSEQSLDRVMGLQRSLLGHYGALLKPGGSMLYATCSLLPSENQRQVAEFLEHNPSWKLEQEVVISPAEKGWDGFYAARLLEK